MNPEDEREVLRRSSKLIRQIGPSAFMVLTHLVSKAKRVDGRLVVETTYRATGSALGLSPSTAGRKFEELRRHEVIAGAVSRNGCRFTVPESVFDGMLSELRSTDQVA